MIERWKNIPGWEGMYQVSDLGRVRSLDREDRLGRFHHGQMLSICDDGKGYRTIRFSRDGSKSMYRVHRLVMLAFVGPCPPGMEVAHADGTQDNNKLTNLRYATPWENSQDKHIHGTIPDRRGGRNPGAILTSIQVRSIRRLVKQGKTQRVVAKQFGVHHNTINGIVRGRHWTHVK